MAYVKLVQRKEKEIWINKRPLPERLAGVRRFCDTGLRLYDPRIQEGDLFAKELLSYSIIGVYAFVQGIGIEKSIIREKGEIPYLEKLVHLDAMAAFALATDPKSGASSGRRLAHSYLSSCDDNGAVWITRTFPYHREHRKWGPAALPLLPKKSR